MPNYCRICFQPMAATHCTNSRCGEVHCVREPEPVSDSPAETVARYIMNRLFSSDDTGGSIDNEPWIEQRVQQAIDAEKKTTTDEFVETIDEQQLVIDELARALNNLKISSDEIHDIFVADGLITSDSCQLFESLESCILEAHVALAKAKELKHTDTKLEPQGD